MSQIPLNRDTHCVFLMQERTTNHSMHDHSGIGRMSDGGA